MRRAASTLSLAVVCALALGAAGARADDVPPPPAPIVAAGVTVGPVAVGGMTLEEATHAILRAFLRPVALSVAGKRVTVSPRRFHIVAAVAAAVQRALAARPGKAIPLRARVDTAKVTRYVQALGERFDRKAVPGRLLLHGFTPAIVGGKPGRTVRELPTRMRLRDALVTAKRAAITVPLRVTKAPLAPQARKPLIVIRRGVNRLTLYRGAKLVRTFPVATGQDVYPTPLGAFHIVVMWKNPTWYPPTQDAWAQGLQPVPPGPDNPLGTRWMGISSPGVGIHGTDEPASIGYSVSHGCIRMQVPAAEWLFDHVTVGTPVYIVSE